MSTNSATPPPMVLLGCSDCGATLPDGARFCLKCGKSVASSPKVAPVSKVRAAVPGSKPRRKAHPVLWILLALLIGVVLWAATSDSSAAQQFQGFVGLKQDRVILDSAFSVGPHTFRYYKFALPEGSVNVAVVGQFTSAADTQSPSRSNEKANKDDKTKATAPDNNIEVYVLTEPAFTVWQNGYATSSLYESGRVAEGTVQAEVPAGPGIYYLIFSNKAALKTAKTVHATVQLHYKSWLPDSVRRMKARFLDWVGIS